MARMAEGPVIVIGDGYGAFMRDESLSQREWLERTRAEAAAARAAHPWRWRLARACRRTARNLSFVASRIDPTPPTFRVARIFGSLGWKPLDGSLEAWKRDRDKARKGSE
jgi:hypothetical protein